MNFERKNQIIFKFFTKITKISIKKLVRIFISL